MYSCKVTKIEDDGSMKLDCSVVSAVPMVVKDKSVVQERLVCTSDAFCRRYGLTSCSGGGSGGSPAVCR